MRLCSYGGRRLKMIFTLFVGMCLIVYHKLSFSINSLMSLNSHENDLFIFMRINVVNGLMFHRKKQR
jgi:hypothetical protein